MKWMSWSINADNGGAGAPGVWDTCRSKWRANGIQDFPWLHCRSMADISRLIAVAKQYDSPAIGLNIEDVVGDGFYLPSVASLVASTWGGPVHMAVLPWVPNGAGWENLSFAVAALEINPDENPESGKIADCLYHAKQEGLTKITLMLKTKGFTPGYYGQFWNVCHSLYTADDISPTASAWNEWIQTQPCEKVTPDVPPVPPKQWYEKPYLTGVAVGPEKLPRALYPPSDGRGTFFGYDVTAYKRAISRAGRLTPWNPSTWSNAYGDAFALGDGSGNLGKSGVRGFQRQQFPNDKAMWTGNMGDKTYQAMRRALVSDPEAPNFKQHIFDLTAIELLRRALKEYNQSAKEQEFRAGIADFCERSEAASSARWTYSQRRPFTGLGVPPEQPHVNDCSSYVVLAYWWGRKEAELNVPDPSGYDYAGFGSTWDDLDGHPKVTSGNYQIGDLAHYDGHVTICRKAGDKDSSVWSSFGSEPKPDRKNLYYRPDFLMVVRPPLE